MDRPLTVPEAAEILNYHSNHLSRLLREGRVEGERVGGRWMISHRAGDCPREYLNYRTVDRRTGATGHQDRVLTVGV